LAEFSGTGYSEKFIRLLIARGIDTKAKAEKFFNYDPVGLHNPYLLKGMGDAIARIKTAIAKKEKVLIIGDYDADGICATAILYKFFLSKRVKTSYFLPEREADGYGLNCELIKTLNDKYSPNLLITVDCGISCHKEIEYAKSLGLDCIVTDHHAIPEITPDCICIDPKFVDQEYPFNDLCGAGVALKVVQAFDGLDVAKNYFDICAIATVADIVSLTDENRIIVHNGLAMLNSGTVIGITALAKACNIRDEIRSGDIGYRLGPKINASGRMGNAKRGLDIMLEKDPEWIDGIIKSLMLLNTKRQELCTAIYDECVDVIEKEHLAEKGVIIVAKPKWGSGVLGIVSARITDKYGKPSIILGGRGEFYRGSGRSITGIDLVDTVSKYSDLLTSFGGHTMAVGITLPTANYDSFVEKMTEELHADNLGVTVDTDKYYDLALPIDALTPEFANEVGKLEPTGCGNPMPVFMTTIRQTRASVLPNYNEHTRFEQGKVKFIFFGGANFNDILETNCEKSVIFEIQQTPDVNDTVKAIVKCVIPFAVDTDELAMVLERYLHGELSTTPDERLTEIINKLSVDRQEFVRYYLAITDSVQKGNSFFGLPQLFGKVNLADKNIFQFVFCFSVFRQLGIIRVDRKRIFINKGKTELEKSTMYNLIARRS
ncbi:MAG: single-stranded-DNA-specific exonuclease RecJ, partial [Christensenellaceae bacterium]|jgi:single-stranded-DNA-specific exonuclease|nr:single-stranded-DNA-specific exonuclease RecJ [Christensenellaceae bacterium]